MHADAKLPHILIINDSPEVLDLFRELLEEESFRVTTWSESTTDFHDIVRLAPNLIIVDQVGVDGILVLQLRESPRTKHIPIVLCTGAVRDVEEIRHLLEGMGVTIVSKPFDIEHLLAVVREALTIAPKPDKGGLP